ncbi:MAG: ferrochelatase [Rudaea sp.]
MPNPANTLAAESNSVTTAVLLLNLGTPDSPTPVAVRRYLAQFLSDPRVIDYPRWLWWPILQGVILPLRPRRSAHAYAKIWTAQGSPLLVHSRALCERVATACPSLRVELAMTYGEPGVPTRVAHLLAAGVRRLLLLPLFPQYSAASTAAALDSVFAALRTQRRLPQIRSIVDYHAAPDYIQALAASVEKYWFTHGRGERLVLSFHGIPERYVRSGDPYHEQCLTTARLLAARLGIADVAINVCFQSRVGREAWLAPYTDATLVQLGQDGVRHAQVLCPGFAVDCLETLEEIALRARDQFTAAGGERLDYIPALNDSASHVQLLCGLIERNTQDWADAGA